MEFTEETQQTIIDLQNQINDLRALTSKNDFSNTYLQNKTVIQHTGAYQSPDFVSGSVGWQLNSDGDLEANTGTFRGTLSASDISGGTITGSAISGGTITGSTITGGTVRTAASGARVQMSSANNRLDIYNSTPTNIGWFGGTGNGNFININQPDTNEDYPPVYVTSAQDSNVFNIYNTNSGISNRPAFRIESNNVNASSATIYTRNTGSGGLALRADSTSNTYPTVYFLQNGTADVLYANGGYIDSSGNWHDGSSRTLKENFENVSVLDRLKDLDIKKYNYINVGRKTKKQIKEQLIDREKRRKYSQTDEGKKDGFQDIKYLKQKITAKELTEINSKIDEEYVKEQKRHIPKCISPVAEDLYEMFGVGDDKSISPKDLAGIALQAVKELAEKVEKLENAK